MSVSVQIPAPCLPWRKPLEDSVLLSTLKLPAVGIEDPATPRAAVVRPFVLGVGCLKCFSKEVGHPEEQKIRSPSCLSHLSSFFLMNLLLM